MIGGVKMPKVVCHSYRVLSSVVKKNISLRHTGVFRRDCSVYTRQCRRLSSPSRTLASASCLQRPHVLTYSVDTRRCFSDGYSETTEETQQVESESKISSQKTSESFCLDVLVSLLRQENAVDICVIKVPDQIKYAQYFIVTSGISTRHIRAMALYAIKVYKFMKKKEDPNVKLEGKDSEDWICVDFGDIVVHLMLPETRDIYELEKLWTLRSYDEQLMNMPEEKLPEDFIAEVDITK
ncbi:mitochondrial assembly of ribosomal large subunit protein 1 [Cynoglossus semilaevis]|uniref:mitochondrial assembly of ribosomal large subunit protein 1 n=1 Tax=Cynoglossus semilaevis TaxID=244447 RepID=UPI0004977CD1|nr:mitochondrial assembly of ribosomal large subunit protein 1 [Cynoglossus semilaevis]